MLNVELSRFRVKKGKESKRKYEVKFARTYLA